MPFVSLPLCCYLAKCLVSQDIKRSLELYLRTIFINVTIVGYLMTDAPPLILNKRMTSEKFFEKGVDSDVT